MNQTRFIQSFLFPYQVEFPEKQIWRIKIKSYTKQAKYKCESQMIRQSQMEHDSSDLFLLPEFLSHAAFAMLPPYQRASLFTSIQWALLVHHKTSHKADLCFCWKRKTPLWKERNLAFPESFMFVLLMLWRLIILVKASSSCWIHVHVHVPPHRKMKWHIVLEQ